MSGGNPKGTGPRVDNAILDSGWELVPFMQGQGVVESFVHTREYVVCGQGFDQPFCIRWRLDKGEVGEMTYKL